MWEVFWWGRAQNARGRHWLCTTQTWGLKGPHGGRDITAARERMAFKAEWQHWKKLSLRQTMGYWGIDNSSACPSGACRRRMGKEEVMWLEFPPIFQGPYWPLVNIIIVSHPSGLPSSFLLSIFSPSLPPFSFLFMYSPILVQKTPKAFVPYIKDL